MGAVKDGPPPVDRVAALYDIHGNLPALEAVLEAIRSEVVDRIVIGGDVLPGPMIRECLDRLRALGDAARFIHGNCELDVLTWLDGGDIGHLPEPVQGLMGWIADALGPDRAWVEGWPATYRMRIPGLGRVLFCHATPLSATDIFTKRTPEPALAAVFEGVEADVVVCGHTHMQFDRNVGGVRVVNAGSAGMPIGEPGAHWLLLGPGIEFRSTGYDVDAAARRLEATDYPDAPDFVARFVLDTPVEAEVLARFERVEIGHTVQD